MSNQIIDGIRSAGLTDDKLMIPLTNFFTPMQNSPANKKYKHKAPVLVIGLGNLLLKDEGIGVHLVNELKKRSLDCQLFEFLDAGTIGLGLIDEIKDRHKVIVIDAVDLKKPPGTVVKFDYPEPDNAVAVERMSLHQLDFIESVKSAYFLYDMPEIHIIGVQVKDISMGLELSSELYSQLEKTVDLLVHVIEREAESHRILTR